MALHQRLSRTTDLALGERRERIAGAADDVDAVVSAREDAGWVVVFDEERRVHDDGDEEIVEVKAGVVVTDVGGGVRLRRVTSTTRSSRAGSHEAFEVARVDADGRPLWRHRVSWRERGGSRSGPDVTVVTAADGSAAVRVKGHAWGTSGHDDYDEYDDTLRLADGTRVS